MGATGGLACESLCNKDAGKVTVVCVMVLGPGRCTMGPLVTARCLAYLSMRLGP